jgi:EAL domain-containing protein (putative c-di-GMP-specific phosphodiesterase class I)
MFRQSCRDAHEWGGGTGLALNMSPWQVCEPHIASRLLRIVFASGLRPDRLTVEITENAVMHDVAAAQATVAALREAGIKVALDDFGSGYASLSRMCKIPLDMIKIDRTLVQSLDSDAGRKLVKVVVDLGQSLAMPVTAEGIETEQQARYLADLGCTFGQGYLFGRPAPADETAALLAGGLTVPLAC